MSYIEKDKNIYKFFIDGKSKPYQFDVNTGILYGLRGAPLQTMPSAIPQLLCRTHYSAEGLSTVLRLLWNGEGFSGQSAEQYKMADRLDSVGYTATTWEIRRLSDNANIIVFKDLVAFLHKKEGNIDDYIVKVKQETFAQRTGLRVDEHFTQEMYEFLYNNYIDTDPKALRVMAYWLSRGVWEYYDGDRYAMRSKLNDTIIFARNIDWEWEKGDFFRTYINLRREYNAKKDEIQNAKIAAYQNARRTALEFSTDDYEVVIPMTAEELRIEGRNQSNCVGGYNSSIADCRCNIVFVRRKADPKKSYITCEIYRSGDIGQFYLSCNRSVYNEDDIAFKVAYQAHIKANWAN